jgi:hypothetical protein
MEEVNWLPLSEVRVSGTPNLEIQVEINARTQDSAEIEDNGTTSGHLVLLSIIVSRYEKP